MLRLAARLVLVALVTGAAVANKPGAEPKMENAGGFQVWESMPVAGVQSTGTNKTVTLVPAIVVDDPATTGKGRRQNACDRCSLCLAKVGSTGTSRDTFKSIYQEGVYQYETRNSSLAKCLSNRYCRACDVGTVTYTLPSTTFAEGEIKRILADVAFPPQSYLLDIIYDITMTDNFGGIPYVADLFTLLGKPGVTYTTTTNAQYLVAATPYQGPFFYESGYISKYEISMSSTDGECYTASTPSNCKAKLRTPLCTRYTYAAEKQNYPVTTFNTDTAGFVAVPTSPTTCFPVTEFDLSKYPIYLGYAYLDRVTYEGTVTLVYTKAAAK